MFCGYVFVLHVYPDKTHAQRGQHEDQLYNAVLVNRNHNYKITAFIFCKHLPRFLNTQIQREKKEVSAKKIH
jgi:hypothetical protein